LRLSGAGWIVIVGLFCFLGKTFGGGGQLGFIGAFLQKAVLLMILFYFCA
jgi:hypothetical protein